MDLALPQKLEFLESMLSKYGRPEVCKCREVISTTADRGDLDRLTEISLRLLEDNAALLQFGMLHTEVLDRTSQTEAAKVLRAFMEAVMPVRG